MVHAQRCEQKGMQRCRVALVRFSGAVEAAFGLTREVMFFYSPYPDLQTRALQNATTMASVGTCTRLVVAQISPQSLASSAAHRLQH
jgi:hypothetical protein